MKKLETKKHKEIDMEKMKKLNGLKNMYFNRYLMIRYALALFVFSNFYWALFTSGHWIMGIPICMLLFAIPPSMEIVRSYGKTSISMNWMKLYYKLQLIVSASLVLVVWTPLAHTVVPFLTDSIYSLLLTSAFFIIGCIISSVCGKRLIKIDTNTDKHFQRIQQYEKALHLHL